MERFLQFLNNFGTGRLVALAAVVIGLVGFFLFVTMQFSKQDMSLLYSDLELSESAEIVERLQALDVPFQTTDNGRAILVPADRVGDLRIQMAGEGLSGRIVGYEIFDRSDGFGTTSFEQQINRLRAVEGELARTIQGLETVRSARVHIVLPERALFSREERNPTASIVLETRGRLSEGQTGAIQFLVSSAVPGLEPSFISIVDQDGRLLARGDGEGGSGSMAGLSEKRRELEEYYRRRIEDLLGRTVGQSSVRAQVAIELDTNAVTTNQETYDPESQVARSTRTNESTSVDRTPGAGNVSVENTQPDDTEAGGDEVSQTETFDETINYEISRTVRTEVKEPGGISRISAAVVVDGRYVESAEGAREYQARSEAELDQLSELVRSAIGYDANRGDQVEVANMQFAEPDFASLEPVEPPFNLLGLEKDDLYKFVEMILYAVVSVLVLLLVVRPLVGRLIAAIPEAPPADQQRLSGQMTPALEGPDGQYLAQIEQRAASGDEEAVQQLERLRSGGSGDGANINVDQVENRLKESSLKKVGEIVGAHPDEAAAIVRSWLYAE